MSVLECKGIRKSYKKGKLVLDGFNLTIEGGRIVGLLGPNGCGKSTFINAFAGKSVTLVGNKPGVTKGKQWIRLNKELELLDTPGILWPKFEDQTVGLHLAMIGSMNDEIVHLDELAYELIKFVTKEYPGILKARYDVEEQGVPAVKRS